MNQAAAREQRKWVRRDADFAVRMIFPTHGLKDVRAANFQLKDISEGGACLYVGKMRTPDFFYLQFGDERSEMVGCYVVHRTDQTVSCRFSQEMRSSDVDGIVARGSRPRPQNDQVRAALDALFEGAPATRPAPGEAPASAELDSLFANAGNLFK
jgi:hypothetical protein